MARGHCRVLRSGFSLTPRLPLLGAQDGRDRWGGPPQRQNLAEGGRGSLLAVRPGGNEVQGEKRLRKTWAPR